MIIIDTCTLSRVNLIAFRGRYIIQLESPNLLSLSPCVFVMQEPVGAETRDGVSCQIYILPIASKFTHFSGMRPVSFLTKQQVQIFFFSCFLFLTLFIYNFARLARINRFQKKL